MDLKELTYAELSKKASKLGYAFDKGRKKDDLIREIEALSSKTETPQGNQSPQENLNKNQPSTKPGMVEIPQKYRHLGIRPTRIPGSIDDYRNVILNKKDAFFLPEEVREEIEREGCEVCWILSRKHIMEDALARGRSYITDKNGDTFEVDAKQTDEKGCREFHVAMKVPRERLRMEQEARRSVFEGTKRKIQDGTNIQKEIEKQNYQNLNNVNISQDKYSYEKKHF